MTDRPRQRIGRAGNVLNVGRQADVHTQPAGGFWPWSAGALLVPQPVPFIVERLVP
jgi:hypothetical protein